MDAITNSDLLFDVGGFKRNPHLVSILGCASAIDKNSRAKVKVNTRLCG